MSGNGGDGPKNLLDEILVTCATQPDIDIEVVKVVPRDEVVQNANPVIVNIEEDSNNLGMTSDHTSLSSLTDSLPHSVSSFIGTKKDVKLVDLHRSCGEHNEFAIAERPHDIDTDKHMLEGKIDSAAIENDEQCNVKSDPSFIDLTEDDNCTPPDDSVIELIGDDDSKPPASENFIDLTK